MSAQMAFAAPIFLSGATQFVVEYAGDFMTQGSDDPTVATYGDFTGTDPDGEIDFIVDRSADPNPPNNPQTWVRQIRWYGLPRDSTGDGGFDVRPLWTLRAPVLGGTPDFETHRASFERNWYLTPPHTADNPYRYECVWGPGDPLPKMIRVIIVLEDRNDRLATPQRFEYVFDVQ
jgi:hypothetical protein